MKAQGSAGAIEEKVDYERWEPAYPQMPLFRDIEATRTRDYLRDCAPALLTVRAAENLMDYYSTEFLYVCVGNNRTNPREVLLPSRRIEAKWAMPRDIAQPGIIGGEILVLSGCPPNIGPTSVLQPSECDAYYLLLRLDDILELRQEFWDVQRTIIRNLLGIVAQVVIDTRYLFYRARHGIDMYAMTAEEKQLYPELHSDDLYGEL
jgi:hypothetical protein